MRLAELQVVSRLDISAAFVQIKIFVATIGKKTESVLGYVTCHGYFHPHWGISKISLAFEFWL